MRLSIHYRHPLERYETLLLPTLQDPRGVTIDTAQPDIALSTSSIGDQGVTAPNLQQHTISIRPPIRLLPLPYRNSEVAVNTNKGCEVYVLIFEGIPNYVALVPPKAYTEFNDTSPGILPIISGIPDCLAPFMVKTEFLSETVESLFAAARRMGPYHDRSLDVQCTWWGPQLTRKAPIQPDTTGHVMTSFGSTLKLCKQLVEIQGVMVYINPLAPAFADFLIKLPGHEQPLRVEHKYTRRAPNARRDTLWWAKDQSSPFAKGRQYDFLLWQAESDEGLTNVCIGRHQWQAAWSNASRLPYSSSIMAHLTFRGPAAIENIV